jgi:hypothetical protein
MSAELKRALATVATVHPLCSSIDTSGRCSGGEELLELCVDPLVLPSHVRRYRCRKTRVVIGPRQIGGRKA